MSSTHNQEFIYALYHWLDGEKIYFYVGRSERAPGIRLKEHIYAANTKTTDVYHYIRERVLCQIFEEEILCWADEHEPDDCEFFWVVKLVRAGHILQNEKHGDAKRIAATDCAATNFPMKEISDVKRYKKHLESERLRQKILQTDGQTARKTPSPLNDWLRQQEFEIAESKRLKQIKTSKREAARLRAEADHQKWLNEHRFLFEAGRKDG